VTNEHRKTSSSRRSLDGKDRARERVRKLLEEAPLTPTECVGVRYARRRLGQLEPSADEVLMEVVGGYDTPEQVKRYHKLTSFLADLEILGWPF